MNIGQPGLPELFEQLGLPSAADEIAAFIARHRPGSRGRDLPDAPVWSAAQAAFLREAITADAEWAIPAEWLANALCGAAVPAADG